MSRAIHQLVTLAPNADASVPIQLIAEKFPYRVSRIAIVGGFSGINAVTPTLSVFDGAGKLCCLCQAASIPSLSSQFIAMFFVGTVTTGTLNVNSVLYTFASLPPDLVFVEGMTMTLALIGASPPGGSATIVQSITLTRFIEEFDNG